MSWESTIRKTQLQRRGCNIFTSMSVTPLDDDNIPTTPSSSSDNTSTTSGELSSSNTETSNVERELPNGDLYMGQWYNDRPHGTGKYLWVDGCMYEGQWYQGKTMGKGKFSWPSGATYEGEFKTGFLDGFGTFTGASGDTYLGSYSMNLKHGHGKRTYVNGDYYEGGWRCGFQEGQGRYIWKSGHEYNGSWRGGVINGKGVLVWANGNCYEGDWADGVPCGKGQFQWADGSLYVGIWSKDPTIRKGVFFPSGTSSSTAASQGMINLPRDPQDDLAADLGSCRVCPGESVSILPSQKSMHWSGELDSATDLLRQQAALWSSKINGSGGGLEKDRRKSLTEAPKIGMNNLNLIRSNVKVPASATGGKTGTKNGNYDRWELDRDNHFASAAAINRKSNAGGGFGGNRDQTLTPERLSGLKLEDADPRTGRDHATRWVPKEMKKQGETISRGHKNYELMLNLQLGIRHSVGKHPPATSLDLKASAFDPKEKVWTKFPSEGSKHTPPHQSCEFRWKDYCPKVFRTLRKLFKVDAADYMLSICGNDALRELSSPGKSGSFFYLTQDDRYMIKTMKKSEVKVLLKMLPAYYNHVRAFENTLVTKFFGLHCVKLTGSAQKKVRFVIMGNLFCSEYSIHRRFDLKGSSHGRTTEKPESEIDEYTTLKDLDLNFIFRLQRSWFQDFHRQVDRDCDFLEQEKIMDYSLLVGLHFRDTAVSRDLLQTEGSSETSNTSDGTPRISRADMDQLLCDPRRWASIKLGVNMPARVEQTGRRSDFDGGGGGGGAIGEVYDVILFFGIIDILQDYDISKKLEHAYKSIQFDPTSISAVDPKQYSRRFRDFIYKVFLEDS